MTRRRTAAAPAPAGPRLDAVPTEPAPGATARCHWATDTNLETDERVLVFVPGCSPMLFNPEHQQCCCDTLAYRIVVHVEQRRDCDEEITALRKRLCAWRRAGTAAYTALTGRDVRDGHIHPEELARAARKAT